MIELTLIEHVMLTLFTNVPSLLHRSEGAKAATKAVPVESGVIDMSTTLSHLRLLCIVGRCRTLTYDPILGVNFT